MKIIFKGWDSLADHAKDDFFMDLEALLKEYNLYGLEEIPE